MASQALDLDWVLLSMLIQLQNLSIRFERMKHNRFERMKHNRFSNYHPDYKSFQPFFIRHRALNHLNHRNQSNHQRKSLQANTVRKSMKAMRKNRIDHIHKWFHHRIMRLEKIHPNILAHISSTWIRISHILTGQNHKSMNKSILPEKWTESVSGETFVRFNDIYFIGKYKLKPVENYM